MYRLIKSSYRLVDSSCKPVAGAYSPVKSMYRLVKPFDGLVKLGYRLVTSSCRPDFKMCLFVWRNTSCRYWCVIIPFSINSDVYLFL